MADCVCTAVGSSLPAGAGADWKGNGVRDRRICALRITLTGSVEIPDLGLPSGLNEKSFAMALHLGLFSLPVDFLELDPELLFDWKRIDVLPFSSSTKASGSAEPAFDLHSLSLGVATEGRLDAVVVGDSAGRLDSVVCEHTLLPRVTSSTKSSPCFIGSVLFLASRSPPTFSAVDRPPSSC